MVQMRDPFSARTDVLLDELSSREREVLQLASLGSKNTEIAEHLGLTVHAVKFHLASVYRKLGVANRTEAAAAFLTAVRRPTT
jgi:DNA-binding NarL/FixJ family response regulator